MPWAAAIPALIGAGGGIASSFINRPPKPIQPQRYSPFFGSGNIQELLYQMLMAKMARSSMFQPSLMTDRMRMMLGQNAHIQPWQMGPRPQAPTQGFITGGQ